MKSTLIKRAIIGVPGLSALTLYLLPLSAAAQAGPPAGGANDLYEVAADIVTWINNILVPVIFAVAFIVFIFGVAQTYIFSRGDEEAVKRGHKLILWGLIGFVIMISFWGLVNILSNTVGLGNSSVPTFPTTTYTTSGP